MRAKRPSQKTVYVRITDAHDTKSQIHRTFYDTTPDQVVAILDREAEAGDAEPEAADKAASDAA